MTPGFQFSNPLRRFGPDAVPPMPVLAPPGGYPRRAIVNHALVGAGTVGMLGGVCAAYLASFAVAPVLVLYGAIGLWLVAAAVQLVALHRSRWSYVNNLKGLKAECYVGQTAQDALLPGNCAVAHGIDRLPGKSIAGDIDHVVATPARVLVVETKWRPVPPDRFDPVLRRIDRNARAVADYLAKLGHTPPVEGRLVFAAAEYEPRTKDVDGRPIRVMDVACFRRELHQDRVSRKGPVTSELAALIRDLGLDEN